MDAMVCEYNTKIAEMMIPVWLVKYKIVVYSDNLLHSKINKNIEKVVNFQNGIIY